EPAGNLALGERPGKGMVHLIGFAGGHEGGAAAGIGSVILCRAVSVFLASHLGPVVEVTVEAIREYDDGRGRGGDNGRAAEARIVRREVAGADVVGVGRGRPGRVVRVAVDAAA